MKTVFSTIHGGKTSIPAFAFELNRNPCFVKNVSCVWSVYQEAGQHAALHNIVKSEMNLLLPSNDPDLWPARKLDTQL